MVLLVIDVQKGITDGRLYNYQKFIDNTGQTPEETAEIIAEYVKSL